MAILMLLAIPIVGLASLWCMINLVYPIKRLGIRTRRSALLFLFLSVMALGALGAGIRNEHMAELKEKDPAAYLVELRKDKGDAAYLNELKELDPARWEQESPAIQAALDEAAKKSAEAKKAGEAAEEAEAAAKKAETDQQIWIVRGQEAVTAKLKDPDSAQFRNAFFHMAKVDGKDVPISCGEVNSKNSFGGYGGFQRYISAGSAESTYLEEEVADFGNAWKLMCVK